MSRLHPKKGIIDLLLPAWEQVRTNAVLLIAGGADAHIPEHAQQVCEKINLIGETSRVRLVGEIPPDQRWKMYDSAEVFVLPSHAENFGIVVAEAMARGCPVAITDQVQASEHVIAAQAGIVVTCSIPALTAALTTLLADSTRRLTCGEAGLAYARTNFDWQCVAVSVRRMYENTLNDAN